MTASTPNTSGSQVGRFRWVICGLLFLAATLNYVDRQVIGFLKPTLQHEFGWSEMDYADIVFAFQVAYAIGLLFAGRMMDRLGTRLGFAIAIVVWSVAAMAHAEATWFGPAVAALLGVFGLAYSASVAGFMAARFVLGLGEAGNFPASIKAVAEWFPKKERALATGIFNSGTNVGALLAPLAVPWITVTYGWYWAFVATGAIGFLWLVPVVAAVPEPRAAPPASAPPNSPTSAATRRTSQVKVPLSQVLPHRQTWAFTIAKFMTDPIWWLYLFWIPDFFSRSYGLDLKKMGLPLFAHLPRREHRQHRRRLAVRLADQAGLERERGAQDGHAGLRARRRADHLRARRPTTCGWPRRWSRWPRPRTRAGRPTSSRSRRTCSRATRSAPSSGSAAWPARSAGC